MATVDLNYLSKLAHVPITKLERWINPLSKGRKFYVTVAGSDKIYGFRTGELRSAARLNHVIGGLRVEAGLPFDHPTFDTNSARHLLRAFHEYSDNQEGTSS